MLAVTPSGQLHSEQHKSPIHCSSKTKAIKSNQVLYIFAAVFIALFLFLMIRVQTLGQMGYSIDYSVFPSSDVN